MKKGRKMSLQKNLRTLLDEKDMTQKGLCDALEEEYDIILLPGTLCRWMSGTQPGNIVIISAIASYFGKTTEELLLN